MSSAVFPALRGLMWNTTKRPQWRTEIQDTVAGRETRIGFMSYPLWNFRLAYDYLPSSTAQGATLDFQNIIDFFNARGGALQNFLFTDPSDYTVTDERFGTGDGVETEFQLTRAIKALGFAEPVMNVNTLTNIKKAGVTQTNPANYSIDSAGLVTFVVAPAAAAALTWTGTYYFRCRFLEDYTDFEQLYSDMWHNKELRLKGSTGLKI